MRYELIGKSVFFPEEKILAIADLHIGYEEALNRAGVFIPRSQTGEIERELKDIFKKTGKLKEIIILGDLKHEFGAALDQEWSDVRRILFLMKENCGKIILTTGNHDKFIVGIVKKFAEIRDFYQYKDIFFMHGERNFLELGDKKVTMILVGHMHPAITIREKYKSEAYKCFLVGKWKSKLVIILPSFFPLMEGSDIIKEETNLALKLNLSSFEVFIPSEDKVLAFGKVKNVERLVN